jgi:hypothetical protein
VLLCGWGYDGFEQVDGEWFFVLDGECNTKMTMKETLENEADLLKPEHNACLRSSWFFTMILPMRKDLNRQKSARIFIVFFLWMMKIYDKILRTMTPKMS